MQDTIEQTQHYREPAGQQQLVLLDRLPAALRAILAQPRPAGPSPLVPSGEVIAEVASDDLGPICALLTEQSEAHFADLFADAGTLDQPGRRERPDALRLHLVLALDDPQVWLHLIAPLTAAAPRYPSLVNTLPAADWYEREVWDEAGIEPIGHPALSRLRLPASWPADAYPLRGVTGDRVMEISGDGAQTEAAARVPLTGADDEREVLDPGPEGVVDYPLGPVRSGVVESGHYTLRTVGEEIVDFRLQLFYKHRGIEQLAVGLTPLHLPLIAERISGTSGFAHALATCEALERAAGVTIPDRARFLRTLFAELERLYNHLGYQADLCQATGLVVGQAQFDILKERILRLNAQLTNHRYLFSACIYGGIAHDLTPEALAGARAHISNLRRQVRHLSKAVLSSPSHIDRLENTGILPPEEAHAWAVVGPIARASGIDRDVRRDHPYAGYDEVVFDVPVLHAGDALARARVRLEEITQTLRILEQVLDKLPGGPVRALPGDPPTGQAAIGWVESPHGEGLHWLQLDSDGRAARYRVRTASFANAQAFPLCIPGRNILTDFPVIEQSWALSYAGVDR